MKEVSVFEARDYDHSDLFGIFLGVHALPGTVMFLHTTVGCKFKTQMHLVDHDWFRESHNERLWTGVDDARLIGGSGERLLEFATTWYEWRRPSLAVVTTNAAVELSDFDVEAAVEALRRRLPCPVLLLKAPGYSGSPLKGYRRFMEAVWSLIEWETAPSKANVALAGYFWDRYEMDHTANVREIKRLLGALGLDLSAVMFSGQSFESLRNSLPKAKTIIRLPLASALPVPGNRYVVDVDLPVGLIGTSLFLREVGRAAGIDRAKVEDLIEREMTRAAPLLAHAARRLRGMRAAVFLEQALAAAVTGFLLDLGLEVALVVLTDGDGEEGFAQRLERLKPETARMPQKVLVMPSRNEWLEVFEAESAVRPVQVAVGSAVQTAALNPHLTFVVELGYPAVHWHALYPMPFMGFNGAVAFAQRLLNAANCTF